MPRYIDADALKDVIQQHDYPLSDKLNSIGNGMFTLGIFQAIDQMPTVSPDEVRGVGKWIMLENQSKEDTDNGNYWYTCSHCSAGDLHAKVQEVPFCWKCGARMGGVQDALS